MKSFLPVLVCLLLFGSLETAAQHSCASFEYQEQEFRNNPLLKQRLEKPGLPGKINQEIISEAPSGANGGFSPIITIPVVVHVIYQTTEQNISDEQIRSQIAVLNEAFRLRGADTGKIPMAFRSLSADCRIEFSLASISPQGYITNGIVRKKTGVYSFGLDDKIKFSATGGDDAWDTDRYLNIWVGHLSAGYIGYSSILGGPREKDGIVVRFDAFGNKGKLRPPYTQGHTAVHEAGHWMGLKHIWGDQYCGNDHIDDTPPQSGSTRGCPSGFIKSCDNSAAGAMYNNYMDITNDECTNMFTLGQRDRMRASFLPGSPHHALLSSKAATAIGIPEPVPQPDTTLTHPVKIYPNPAADQISVDISAQEFLMGKMAVIYNQQGQQVNQFLLTKTVTTLSLRSFKEGIYYIRIGGKSAKIIKTSSGAF